MVEIDLQTVKAIVQIIDVCSKRGAFEGGELSQVGQVRESILMAAQEEIKKEQEEQKASNNE